MPHPEHTLQALSQLHLQYQGLDTLATAIISPIVVQRLELEIDKLEGRQFEHGRVQTDSRLLLRRVPNTDKWSNVLVTSSYEEAKKAIDGLYSERPDTDCHGLTRERIVTERLCLDVQEIEKLPLVLDELQDAVVNQTVCRVRALPASEWLTVVPGAFFKREGWQIELFMYCSLCYAQEEGV